MRISTSGTGMVNATPACSPGNKDIYLADIANFKNLTEDFQHITLKQVMDFCILVHGWGRAAYDYSSSL
jgi:hypothetical protein